MRATAVLLACGMAFTVGCAANAAPLTLQAVVDEARGDIAVRPGNSCTVAMRPDWRQGVNCHVSIVCGATSLFGGKRLGGYAQCDTRDGAFLTAQDEKVSTRDGDPALLLDLDAPQVRVWDDRPGWVVTLRVTPVITGPVSRPAQHTALR